MNNNAELQKDVQEKIKREPLLNAVEFGVKGKDFPVTLTVSVGNYIKKSKDADDTKKYGWHSLFAI